MRVFNVDTELVDLSSEVIGLSTFVMVFGIVSLVVGIEKDWPGDHFLVVGFPNVETESSSFPYAVVLRVIGWSVDVTLEFIGFSCVVADDEALEEMYCAMMSESSRKFISSS